MFNVTLPWDNPLTINLVNWGITSLWGGVNLSKTAKHLSKKEIIIPLMRPDRKTLVIRWRMVLASTARVDS